MTRDTSCTIFLFLMEGGDRQRIEAEMDGWMMEEGMRETKKTSEVIWTCYMSVTRRNRKIRKTE